MKRFDGIDLTFTALITAIGVGVGMHMLNGLASKHVDPQLIPANLIEIKILEQCNDGGKVWFLVETKDKQRCDMNHYRGKPGDACIIDPANLMGYTQPQFPPREPNKKELSLDEIKIEPKAETSIQDCF